MSGTDCGAPLKALALTDFASPIRRPAMSDISERSMNTSRSPPSRLRLKVDADGRIQEAETIVVRQSDSGIKFENQRYWDKPILNANAREPGAREEMVRLSNGYFDTLQLNDGTLHTRFHPDCNRVENGVQTTRQSGFRENRAGIRAWLRRAVQAPATIATMTGFARAVFRWWTRSAGWYWHLASSIIPDGWRSTSSRTDAPSFARQTSAQFLPGRIVQNRPWHDLADRSEFHHRALQHAEPVGLAVKLTPLPAGIFLMLSACHASVASPADPRRPADCGLADRRRRRRQVSSLATGRSTPTISQASASRGQRSWVPAACSRPPRWRSTASCTPAASPDAHTHSTRPPARKSGASNPRWTCRSTAMPAATWPIAGVAVAIGKVYVSTLDGWMYALDAASGKIVWKTDAIVDRTRGYTSTGAPEVAGDVVVIGNGGGEYDVRGYVSAFDLDTGQLKWRFWDRSARSQARAPGSSGSGTTPLKTWDPNSRWDIGGGGASLDAINYDPETGLFSSAPAMATLRHSQALPARR